MMKKVMWIGWGLSLLCAGCSRDEEDDLFDDLDRMVFAEEELEDWDLDQAAEDKALAGEEGSTKQELLFPEEDDAPR